MTAHSNLLFLGTAYDAPFLPYLKSMFLGKNVALSTKPIELLTHLEMVCTKNAITGIVSTNTTILRKLLELQGNFKSNPSLSDYAGSLFRYKNLEILFISPLPQLLTVPYGKFICSRFISKLVDPGKWIEATEFRWRLLDPSNIQDTYNDFSSSACLAIAVDIETFKRNLAIRCIGYTAIFETAGRIQTLSVVLPITDDWSLAWMRKFNSLGAPKIFQNGKYDNAYLLRYNAAPTNWLWDTAHIFHCWYSELPKDLGFLNAFFLREVVYWKDLAETQDLQEYYRYNALDTWATANVWISQMLQLPDWARHNYLLEFPLVFPCLLAEMTGIKRDMDRLAKVRPIIDSRIEDKTNLLRRIFNAPKFNPGSPVQVKAVLKLLGCGDITSSAEPDLKKAAYRHPLNQYIFDIILDVRGDRKMAKTYLRTDEDRKNPEDEDQNGAKEFCGRILYSLNPHGTDTARLASRESAFWCGLQIQNGPREGEYKTTICADDGFYLGESDLEQAESRDTAYISGDTKLIEAVSSSRDFHSVNASAFFGVPYELIYDDSLGKTLDKKLRDLSKRTNHGANYNMGPGVMVETMGLPNVWEAKKLLRLPYSQPLSITEHLLTIFHETYTKLRGRVTIKSKEVRERLGLPESKNKYFSPGTYYHYVATEVQLHNKLVSRAFHHTEFNIAKYKGVSGAQEYIERGDWTRYCFGNPSENKRDLNSLVAHCPQSLNARTLNEAFMKVFYEVSLPNPETFRLHAQIHDSILFSYRSGNENLAERVRECMEIPVTVRDISGTYRTFTVPAALKIGKKDKVTGELVRAKYWNETE